MALRETVGMARGGSCEEGAGVAVGERGFCRADRRAVPQKAGQASRKTVVFMKFFYFLRHKRREGSEKMHSYAEIRLHSVEGSLVCPLRAGEAMHGRRRPSQSSDEVDSLRSYDPVDAAAT